MKNSLNHLMDGCSVMCKYLRCENTKENLDYGIIRVRMMSHHFQSSSSIMGLRSSTNDTGSYKFLLREHQRTGALRNSPGGKALFLSLIPATLYLGFVFT